MTFYLYVTDKDNNPISGAVVLIDTMTTTAIPRYTNETGMVAIDGLADGTHVFEVHIEGRFPGVRFTLDLPYKPIFTLALYWD